MAHRQLGVVVQDHDLLGFSDYRYRLVDSRNLPQERRHQVGPKKDRQRWRTGSTLLNELGFNSGWIEKCLEQRMAVPHAAFTIKRNTKCSLGT
jgi:hypothetical protein